MSLADLILKKGKLIHDDEKCSYCGLCEKRCPHKALKVDKEKKHWRIKFFCMRCGRCVRECSQEALCFEENKKILRQER